MEYIMTVPPLDVNRPRSNEGLFYTGATNGYTVFNIAPIATSKWIMTDDQINRLNTLAREIAIENNLVLSTHSEKESFSLSFYEKSDEEEVGSEEE
jgi:hypothetical protein